MKHMADGLEENRATGAKTLQENAQEPTSLVRGWVTHSPWQYSPAHRGCCYLRTSRLMVERVTSSALQSTRESTRLRPIPKVKKTLRGRRSFSLKELLPTVPKLLDTLIKVMSAME